MKGGYIMSRATAVGAGSSVPGRGGEEPISAAKDLAKSPGMDLITRVGYMSKGVMYIIIGALALLAANNAGGAMTDNNGAIQTLADVPFGRALLIVVTAGLVGYALWYIVRGVLDLDREGSEPKDLLIRGSYILVGISYLALVYGAIQVIAGFGSAGKSTDNTAKDWTSLLLAQGWGVALLVLAGLVVLGVALFQFYQAYKASFKNKLDLAKMDSTQREWIVRLGRFGLAARGLVYLVIAFFLVFAAFFRDPSQAKGIGGALTFLAQQPYGSYLGTICALGLLAYGLFSLAQARYLRLDQLRDNGR